MEEFSQMWTRTTEQFPLLIAGIMTVAAALAILVIGWVFARWVRGRVNKVKFGKHEIDPTLRPVIASVVFYIVMAMTLYAFLIKLGVPPASLLAVFGAAGLAIGLALKDTLSNIAAGVMMLILRPLAVGDFVETDGFAGTVTELGLFATTIKSFDGLFMYVPNSQVWTDKLVNYGRHQNRKAIIDIGVGYDTDLAKCRDLMLEAMSNFEGVTEEPTPPEAYVMGFGDSAIDMNFRCWMPGDNWFKRASDLRIHMKETLDKADIEIPFPQRVLTMTEAPVKVDMKAPPKRSSTTKKSSK